MKKLMYFIGAGATKCCGVPDTSTFLRLVHSVNPKDPEGLALSNQLNELYEFIKSFYESIYGKTDLEYIYTKVIDYINQEPIIKIKDINQSFTLLKNFQDQLRMENDNSEAIRFILEGNLRDKLSKDQNLCRQLKKQLEKLIYYFYWRSMQYDKIDLLNELFGMNREVAGFEKDDFAVFTTNYDICIDEYFIKWRNRINDGFDYKGGLQVFNSDLLEFDDLPKLFKLHGSVNWIELDDERIIKTDDRVSFTRNDYRNHEIKQRILIYPILAKAKYEDKRINLIPYLEEWVRNVDLILSVGYSYRDDAIKGAIFRNANKETTLVHISPNADSDKYKTIFEDFPGRFIPVARSYPGESFASDIISLLRDLYRS